MTRLAIIGGSGLAGLPELNIQRRQIVRTPYGQPESPLLFGRIGSIDVVFLIRHGLHNHTAPDQINYRANIWALHSIGIERIVAVSAVSALHDNIAVGSLILPHDLIDYSRNRADTFDEPVHSNGYLDFRQPYDENLRQQLTRSAQQRNTPLNTQGIYACISGNRLPTLAEAQRMRRDGADVFGMSGMPEAQLAHQLNIAYAHLCAVVGCGDLPVDNTATGIRRQVMLLVRDLLSALS